MNVRSVGRRRGDGSGERDGWAYLTDAGGLLEGVADLQHGQIVAMAADDLDADRQPLGREAGRHRDRGRNVAVIQ